MKNTTIISLLRPLAAGLSLLAVSTSTMFAESTPTLTSDNIGPAQTPLASGTGVLVAGTGLKLEPNTINFTVPAGSTIKQILLYWTGMHASWLPGDGTAIVNGNNVVGTLVGGPLVLTQFNVYAMSAYRADITSLIPAGSGPKAVAVDGLDFGDTVNFGAVNHGAGVVVILDNGSGQTANIQLRDGVDFAFFASPGTQQGTELQTYTFPAAGVNRIARLAMHFSSVKGTASGGGFRPSSIEVKVGSNTYLLSDVLDSVDGEEWDSLGYDVPIPPGATSVTVQAFSRSDLGNPGAPASFNWIASALSVPPGQQQDPHGFTPGYWKNKLKAWPKTGYVPTQLITTLFTQASLYPTLASKTLLQSLQGGGGPGLEGAARILLRAATAAALNAASAINYPLTTAQVIAQVNTALASQDRAIMLDLATQLDLYNNLH